MPRSSEEETIEAMAAAWLAQRDDGLTPGEEQEFARWRAGDPRREAAVARLEKTWSSLQHLRDFRPEARAHPDRDLLAPDRSGRAFRFPTLGLLAGLAAAVAVVVVVRWPESHPVVAPAPVAQTFATAAEGFQRVNLADGSVVDLNGGSELRVTYARHERRVTLLRGEALFTVAKDASRPFWVEAGSMTVRAVGTAFKVRLEPSTVEVLVTEGRVQVDDTRVAALDPGQVMDDLVRRLRAVLDAGERIKVALDALPSDAAVPVIERLAPEAVRAELAWQDSWLVFADTPLGEVVAQFNARNRVQLALGDPALAALPIGGTFRAENIEGFVRLLAATNDVAIDRPAADRIVLRAGR